jgi:hypothetical protein
MNCDDDIGSARIRIPLLITVGAKQFPPEMNPILLKAAETQLEFRSLS